MLIISSEESRFSKILSANEMDQNIGFYGRVFWRCSSLPNECIVLFHFKVKYFLSSLATSILRPTSVGHRNVHISCMTAAAKCNHWCSTNYDIY